MCIPSVREQGQEKTTSSFKGACFLRWRSKPILSIFSHGPTCVSKLFSFQRFVLLSEVWDVLALSKEMLGYTYCGVNLCCSRYFVIFFITLGEKVISVSFISSNYFQSECLFWNADSNNLLDLIFECKLSIF